MRNTYLIFTLLASLFVFGQRTCGTSKKMEELYAKNPEMRAYAKEMRAYLENPNHLKRTTRTTAVVTIPVVVHVLYEAANQNISDAQIQSQITVLNQDFRKLNADYSSVVPAAFQPYGADLEMTFCLATKDPNGNATNGIVRKSVGSTFDFDENYYKSTGDLAWDPTKYLNIWVGDLTDTKLLGWAYLPEGAAGKEFDGLAIGYQYFGTMGTAVVSYDKGRTATHEIGHYFGLNHPWGEDNSACGTTANDDGVADTPAIKASHFGCPTFPDNSNMCTATTNGAMFMNFMDYVDDKCMAFFTNGQKTITQNTLSGPRASLLISNNGCASNVNISEAEAIEMIKMFPNPASSSYISVASPGIVVDEIEIYDATGKLVLKKANLSVQEKINIQRLSIGIYYVRVFNKGKFLKSEKFIKK